MASMMIVDDEAVERNGIKMLLKRFGFDLSVTGANSGERALEMLSQNPVDILFVDICMPGMDGLELLEKALCINPDIIPVVFSGYAEFSYAQRAMQMGVRNYLIKPVNVDEFKRVMQSVCDQYEARRQALGQTKQYQAYERSQFLLRLLMNGDMPNDYKKRLTDMGMGGLVGKSRFLLIYNDCYDAEKTRSIPEITRTVYKSNIHYVLIDPKQLFMAVEFSDSWERFLEYTKNLMDALPLPSPIFIVPGDPVDSITQLHMRYDEMRSRMDERFTLDKSCIIKSQKDFYETLPEEKFSAVFSAIECKNTYGMREALKALFDDIEARGGVSHVYIKTYFTKVVETIGKYFKPQNRVFMLDAMERLFRAQTLEALRKSIDALITDLENERANTDERDYDAVVKQILDIISSRYNEDISLESITGEVYLSAGYTSHIFREQTGQSIVKYIIRYRMNKAKSLLITTNRRVAQIAADVGYDNAAYFGRIFKCCFGCTPNEYRQGKNNETSF